MSDENHIPDRLEIYINEQRADLELFRLIIQMCLVQVLDTFPEGRGPDYLNDFESEIASALKTSPTQSTTEEARFHELMLMRAESFFLTIRKKKGYPIRVGDNRNQN
jgi:hypothetical protein